MFSSAPNCIFTNREKKKGVLENTFGMEDPKNVLYFLYLVWMSPLVNQPNEPKTSDLCRSSKLHFLKYVLLGQMSNPTYDLYRFMAHKWFFLSLFFFRLVRGYTADNLDLHSLFLEFVTLPCDYLEDCRRCYDTELRVFQLSDNFTEFEILHFLAKQQIGYPHKACTTSQ